ncbi:DUF2585 domain-containing protein [Gellertiella hungarica]|uniref:UPF0314 protein GGR23_002474 n=1 Tax=Gellertiella hungarica TaxID=1572859 RepID=A0A7W6NKW4_9HYPH|nr:DUF2585 domain-containing protein [Gellertiella hungarica]MBB4065273.1 hypothetical protein [Gellertiella hungarica]
MSTLLPAARDRAIRWVYIVLPLFVLTVQAALERWMGRVWICTCGDIKLFEASVHSEGNSQHIADWYSPSHVEHGFIFYGLSFLLLSRFPKTIWLAAALALESFWEILENTPLIIDRYRAATISYHYYGDSILNSVMDTLMMTAGFWLASRLPVRLTIALALFAELLTLYLIRDNLTLNVIMLIHPVEAIRMWQSAL